MIMLITMPITLIRAILARRKRCRCDLILHLHSRKRLPHRGRFLLPVSTDARSRFRNSLIPSRTSIGRRKFRFSAPIVHCRDTMRFTILPMLILPGESKGIFPPVEGRPILLMQPVIRSKRFQCGLAMRFFWLLMALNLLRFLSRSYKNGINGLRFDQRYPSEIADLGLIGTVGTVIASDFHSAAVQLPRNAVALLNAGFNFPRDHGKNLPVIDAKKKNLLSQMQSRGLLKPGYYDSKRQLFRAANGQILLDRKNGCFQVCTPGAEVLILPPGRTGCGKFIKIDNKVGRGVFAAIVHTGSTLIEAKRILLLHLTDTQGSKTKFRSAAMNQLESFGVAPFLAKRGAATLTLQPKAGKFRCYALNTAGKRLAEIAPVKTRNGLTQFSLQVFQPEGVVMAYEFNT